MTNDGNAQTFFRRRWGLWAAAIGVVCIGLALRGFGYRIGLPFFVVKYGGSFLWGAMVYLLVAGCAARASREAAMTLSLMLAVAVEFSRLYHTPWIDEFRLTMAGALLLGRVFSPWNILAYAFGILIAFKADRIVAFRSKA